MRCAAAMSGSPPAARSRSRRAPRRSGAAGRRSVSVLRVIFSAATSERLGDLLADLAERLLGRLLDLALRSPRAAASRSSSVSSRIRSLLGVGDLARLGEDRLGLAPRLRRSARGAPRAGCAPPRGRGRPPRPPGGSARAGRRSASGSGRTRSASSTHSVIANETSVQIIRPGMTWISGFVAASIVLRRGRSRAGRRGSRRRRRPR